MISGELNKRLGQDVEDFFRSIDQVVTPFVISSWAVPVDDVACSGTALLYTRNDAAVQLELRYTTGKGIYSEGKVFSPSLGEQIELAKEIKKHLVEMFYERYGSVLPGRKPITCSVWMKPYPESHFET
jgi:hypothetical protein